MRLFYDMYKRAHASLLPQVVHEEMRDIFEVKFLADGFKSFILGYNVIRVGHR